MRLARRCTWPSPGARLSSRRYAWTRTPWHLRQKPRVLSGLASSLQLCLPQNQAFGATTICGATQAVAARSEAAGTDPCALNDAGQATVDHQQDLWSGCSTLV